MRYHLVQICLRALMLGYMVSEPEGLVYSFDYFTQFYKAKFFCIRFY